MGSDMIIIRSGTSCRSVETRTREAILAIWSSRKVWIEDIVRITGKAIPTLLKPEKLATS